ncbi:competence/damage-inducible protein A [Clostridium algidicarnis]|uniref:Putative competence-damage inducible protein n=1 Tax=Clostridium algidicarnis TaxID=37659 RepID=A0ABS6C6F0_9CLOT|nr:competence/damage-inducible protein A [Clostridium algidicarnis]MBU3197642.1 competence/damage-inducible protein A [Clostridium algidicarnis]MBU3205350.1 competence/damage-inducible protein A [Clostridium algidicarnis]MBU3213504.1 competence/damage-inducible protein A [Clostridium algidicarnis]MBU3221070.1 competence/damage-inducible protein A [Clostridium algidicarnis]MBU3223933.1 competence/damage-inducible protein A [Clostridium algidicarnis]
MKAEIIAVGTELLLGDILNTNAQFLSKELAILGIEVYHQTVIGDNGERLLEAFDEAFKRCDVVITSGGLGPTKDDITKEMAAKYFGKELTLNEEELKNIEKYFNKTGKKMTENNRKQAYFPKDDIILKNNNGTAPGAIMKGENGGVIIVLPGPPKELIPMFKESVVPYLRNTTDSTLYSKVLRLFGIGESTMEDEIKDILESQTNPTVAPYAKELDLILRITSKAKNEEEAKKLIEPLEKQIRQRLPQYIYGENDDTLESVVGEKLIKENLTISSAESCTGGMLSARLINVPSISKVFIEGAVTYSNQAKVSRLSVKKETLEKYGAVSKETAIEMAEGIAKTANTDIGISTTGIAGPDGGTNEKPVGLVYIGLYIKGNTLVKELNIKGNREKIRTRATIEALNFLRIELNKL